VPLICPGKRNRLKGVAGDAVNAVLATAAMNFQKLLRAAERKLLARIVAVLGRLLSLWTLSARISICMQPDRGFFSGNYIFSPTGPAFPLQYRGINKNGLSAGWASASSATRAGAGPNIRRRAASLALNLQISGAPRIGGRDPE
jgi:hypothetical protein